MTANRIARWDGTAWSALSGPSGTGYWRASYALAVFDDGSGPALYAGGYFTTAGGVTVNNIARWDGSAWSALAGPSGTGIDSSVVALAVFDDGSGPALYAGGLFTTAGGVTVNRIARWNGSAWSALSGPCGTGVGDGSTRGSGPSPSSTTAPGPPCIAGGNFDTAGGRQREPHRPLGRLRLVRPRWVVARGCGPVRCAPWRSSTTAAGPRCTPAVSSLIAGGVTVNHIARWDGSPGPPLSGPSGVGVNGNVYALTVYDDGSGPALYAGGRFTTAGGVTVNHIARWDGTAWSALTGPAGHRSERQL